MKFAKFLTDLVNCAVNLGFFFWLLITTAAFNFVLQGLAVLMKTVKCGECKRSLL